MEEWTQPDNTTNSLSPPKRGEGRGEEILILK
jgi:hypothetical protein